METLFGVWSLAATNTKLKNGYYLFDWIMRQRCFPAFWGRPISGPDKITTDEMAFLKEKDCKTMLQEIIQRNREEHIEYVLIDSSGPDHAKVFTVEVHLNSNVIAKGTAGSKKRAEQEAAKVALELMGQTL